MTLIATLDSIGEWFGQEQEAVDLWNDYIAPVLFDLRDAQDTNDPTVSIEPPLGGKWGIAASADHWAWNEFCGRLGQVNNIMTDEAEAEEIVINLANELRQRGA